MAVGWCPECGSEIGLGPSAELAARVTCPSCGAYLEIISLSPVELDWAFDQPVGQMQYDYDLGDRSQPA
jgi:lysine biosynthesis protein LysW